MCLEYYGYLIKKALREQCKNDQIAEETYPPGFSVAMATLKGQKKRFAADKTNGFGGPEQEECV
jgi:hypothetical protein